MNMLLIFGSATAAKRVEKTVAKYGVIAKVIHTPANISKSGCSHSVKINEKDFRDVVRVLSNSDIKILGAFKEYNVSGKVLYKEMVI